jgi:long-chain acyl-CoA synthetase
LTLVPTPMSVENGLLTPTFKIKRQEAQKVFQADLDRMYGK